MSAATGTVTPRTFAYWGDSHPGWLGSFQIDHRLTCGNCVATARTKSPNIRGRGRHVRRLATDPWQRDAHAGPAPVTVRMTDSPRASAPAIIAPSMSQVPGA